MLFFITTSLPAILNGQKRPPFISFPDFIWQLQLFFLSLRKIQRCTKSLISIQDFKNGRQKIYSPTN